MALGENLHHLIKPINSCCGNTCPRYTSYPPANKLADNFDRDKFSNIYHQNISNLKELNLYCHIPFCSTLCFFCACNREITKDYSRVQSYLEALKKEILLVSNSVKNIPITALHFGGGTPNYLNPKDLKDLVNHYKENFNFHKQTELSIELDQRTCTDEHIAVLAECGFSRVSIGVQDFNPIVQKKINRIQSFESTVDFFNKLRSAGINNLGIDLIYGLPLQTKESFSITLDKVIDLNPSRIALYGYAHVQQMAPGQKAFEISELPNTDLRLELLSDAISEFCDNDYEFIGIDHFVKKSDPLFQAYKNGTMGRSFMGYTHHRGIPVIACGASSISSFDNLIIQNIRSVKAYQDYFHNLSNEKLSSPIEKILIKSQIEVAVSEAIESILTVGKLNFNELSRNFKNISADIIEHAIEKLEFFRSLGLLTLTEQGVNLSLSGQIFGRAIASSLDIHIPNKLENNNHSIQGSLII
jgi:oxygen-independent coproporphyrinogen-3 oxidase